MRHFALASLLLSIAACGPSDSGPKDFVVQSVFDGSCVSSDASQCASVRQNSDPYVDVRAIFQAACSPGTYSANACSAGWAGCCLILTPSDVAGDFTKLLTCDATISNLSDYQAACTTAGGTYYASVPQL